MVNHHACGHRTAVATAKWDDAKGASVIAAILHLDKGAGFAGKGRYQMRRGLPDRHNVRNQRFAVTRFFEEQAGVLFLGIAQYRCHLGHRSKTVRIDLRRASRHNDPRIGAAFARLADGLPRLAHGFVGNRATVDNDQIVRVA